MHSVPPSLVSVQSFGGRGEGEGKEGREGKEGKEKRKSGRKRGRVKVEKGRGRTHVDEQVSR